MKNDWEIFWGLILTLIKKLMTGSDVFDSYKKNKDLKIAITMKL